MKTPPEFSDAEIAEIADRQRIIIRMAALGLILFTGSILMPTTNLGVGVSAVLQAIFALMACLFSWRLARAMKMPVALFVAVFALIPCLNVFGILALNAAATSLLKSQDLRVGFLSADPGDIDRLRRGEFQTHSETDTESS